MSWSDESGFVYGLDTIDISKTIYVMEGQFDSMFIPNSVALGSMHFDLINKHLPGEDVVIVPAVKDEEAKKLYPNGWKTLKPYLRKVPDPSK